MQQEQKRMNILSYLKGYKKECFLSPLFKLLEACFDLTVPLVMAAIINKGIADMTANIYCAMAGC